MSEIKKGMNWKLPSDYEVPDLTNRQQIVLLGLILALTFFIGCQVDTAPPPIKQPLRFSYNDCVQIVGLEFYDGAHGRIVGYNRMDPNQIQYEVALDRGTDTKWFWELVLRKSCNCQDKQ